MIGSERPQSPNHHPRALRNCLTNALSLRCQTSSTRFPSVLDFLRAGVGTDAVVVAVVGSALPSSGSSSRIFPESHSLSSPRLRHLTSRTSRSPSSASRLPPFVVRALFSQRSISSSPNPASRIRSACLFCQARRSRSASSALSQS